MNTDAFAPQGLSSPRITNDVMSYSPSLKVQYVSRGGNHISHGVTNLISSSISHPAGSGLTCESLRNHGGGT